MTFDLTAFLKALLGIVAAYDQVATGGAKPAADKAVAAVATVESLTPIVKAAATTL